MARVNVLSIRVLSGEAADDGPVPLLDMQTWVIVSGLDREASLRRADEFYDFAISCWPSVRLARGNEWRIANAE